LLPLNNKASYTQLYSNAEAGMEFFGIFLLGWASGWIINYLGDVLPVHLRLTIPVCVHCKETIPWRDYLLFRACPYCEKKRAARTWVVQIGAPLVAIFLYLFPPARLGFWIGFGLLAFFALVAVIDLEYRIILRLLYVLGALLGLAIGWMIRGPLETILGGIAGFGIMLGLFYLGILFTRVIGRLRQIEIEETALGFGDVYLMAGLGLMMGWPEVIGGLLLALIIGGLVSGGIILGTWLAKRYEPLQAIPYAPFLLLAAVIMIYIPKQ
jgi:prepilin signal peptidase PulO-like enzyme (type II secretory pathway)